MEKKLHLCIFHTRVNKLSFNFHKFSFTIISFVEAHYYLLMTRYKNRRCSKQPICVFYEQRIIFMFSPPPSSFFFCRSTYDFALKIMLPYIAVFTGENEE